MFNHTTNLFCHLWHGLLFILEERIYTFLAELLCIEVSQDIIQLVKWIICHLSLTSIINGFIMPIVIECRIISIRRQNLTLQSQVLIIQHPLSQVCIIEILLAIILIGFFIDISLIIIPVVVLELEENLLANGICNMLQHTQLWINHAFDTKRVYFLGTRYWNLSVCTYILGLIILQRKIIHILECISTNNIMVYCIIGVDKKHARIHVVANYLRQFGERVNCQTILINITI